MRKLLDHLKFFFLDLLHWTIDESNRLVENSATVDTSASFAIEGVYRDHLASYPKNKRYFRPRFARIVWNIEAIAIDSVTYCHNYSH
ncbi:uncharacterized protein PHALS_14874 [Plasmopara halstedii]|uniref:Uncharacterized protein n=1 Tax=Plasmopara halstedii TaxID=4781 RepID=A0A0P1A7Y6_PLAHL|nr:uncharacterized protein PHALS_14874 [Plasmopara halstedii]CEG36417.1 hypothetical protein PHALS_14874 [Plasmopara halstedii]|eukprot:XP_024572786.1 hypothetical protein PHALS_14874 [Plasmopara halstedii]